VALHWRISLAGRVGTCWTALYSPWREPAWPIPHSTLWCSQLTSRATDERRIIPSPTPTTRTRVKSFYRPSSWAAAPTSTSSVCRTLITRRHPAGACTHVYGGLSKEYPPPCRYPLHFLCQYRAWTCTRVPHVSSPPPSHRWIACVSALAETEDAEKELAAAMALLGPVEQQAAWCARHAIRRACLCMYPVR
jgi:hypothetical protein